MSLELVTWHWHDAVVSLLTRTVGHHIIFVETPHVGLGVDHLLLLLQVNKRRLIHSLVNLLAHADLADLVLVHSIHAAHLEVIVVWLAHRHVHILRSHHAGVEWLLHISLIRHLVKLADHA